MVRRPLGSNSPCVSFVAAVLVACTSSCGQGQVRPATTSAITTPSPAPSLMPSSSPTAAPALASTTSPSARRSPALTQDGNGHLLLFGGWDNPSGSMGTALNDTYAWDGQSWTRLGPQHSPSPRYNAQLAWNAQTHQIILFGGTTVGS